MHGIEPYCAYFGDSGPYSAILTYFGIMGLDLGHFLPISRALGLDLAHFGSIGGF